MVDKLTTFAQRLKHLRKARGLSLAALGEKMGVSAQAVHKWEQGGQIESYRQLALARALDVSIEWIVYGDGEASDRLLIEGDLPDRPAPPDDRDSSLVPKMSTEFMLQWLIGNGERLKGVEWGVDWIPCPAPHGPRTYALEISDESMTNPGSSVSYAVGDIIFVDPDRKYQKNSRVVLFDHTANNEFSAIVREMFARDGGLHIRALNPAWDNAERELMDDDHLSGTVIGVWRPE